MGWKYIKGVILGDIDDLFLPRMDTHNMRIFLIIRVNLCPFVVQGCNPRKCSPEKQLCDAVCFQWRVFCNANPRKIESWKLTLLKAIVLNESGADG